MSDSESNNQPKPSKTKFAPTFLDKNYQCHDFSIGNNGFLLQNIYLPEEILLHIFSYVDPKELLNYSLVCQNWKRLIRSDGLWCAIYERRYSRKANKLPWYLHYCVLSTSYFDTNLLEIKDKVEHRKESYRLGRIIESESTDVQDLKETSNVCVLCITAKQSVQFLGWCATCRRHYILQWFINFEKNKLLQHILATYKPHIGLVKWGSKYELRCGLLENDGSKFAVRSCCETHTLGESHFTYEWLNLVITRYPEGIEGILLEQKYCSQDIIFANKGSAKLLFDSIQPINEDKLNESKKFSTFEFTSEKQPLEDIPGDN